MRRRFQYFLSLRGEMDCFAEPVIGRAFARPVGSHDGDETLARMHLLKRPALLYRAPD